MEADILIKDGVVIPMDASSGVIANGYVAITGDRISAVGSGEPQIKAKKVISADGGVILPGLINTHSHQTMMRGVCEDLPLMDWLEKICFPIDSSLQAPDIKASSLMCQAEMLLGGTTTFVDLYRYPQAAAEVAEQTGIRAVIASQVIDHPVGTGETYAGNLEFVKEWVSRGKGRIRPWFGVHAPYSNNIETYQAAAKAAKEYGVGVHTHLCETKSEVEQVQAIRGCSPIAWLAKENALSERMLAAHCVHVDKEDIKIMLDAGVKVAYNPCSNMKLASGVAPVTDMIAAGLTVGLATDSNLSNNNLDLFEEMRVGAMLQKLITLDASALPATEVLKMATIYGAECLGLEDEIGSLEVGKKADVIIVDLNRPHMWPRFTGEVNNVIANLVYSANAADVRTTIVDGKLLVDKGQLLGWDLEKAFAEVQAAAHDLYRRAQKKMS